MPENYQDRIQLERAQRGHALGLAHLVPVSLITSNTASVPEPMQCPRCLAAIVTGRQEHIYIQNKNYCCTNCEAELRFMVILDHPLGGKFRYAALTSIN